MKRTRTRWPGVYRQGDRFVAVAWIGGRQRWRTFDTAKEARDWKSDTAKEARGRKSEQHDGPDTDALPGPDPTVDEVLDRWLATRASDWRPNTLKARRSLRRLYLSELGELRVSEIDRARLRGLYASASPGQARGLHELLRAAFRWARAEELVVHDPSEGVRGPAYVRPRRATSTSATSGSCARPWPASASRAP